MGKHLHTALGVLFLSMACSIATESTWVEVPTRLALKRTPDTLQIGIASTPMEKIEIQRDKDLFAGVRCSIRVFPAGEKGPHPAGRESYSSPISFTGWTSILNSSEGVPTDGVTYTVEVETIIFETDTPPGHLWMPDTSHVLWKRILRQSSPEGRGSLAPVANFSNGDEQTYRRISGILRNAGIEWMAAGSASLTVSVDSLQADYARYKIAKAVVAEKLDVSVVDPGEKGKERSPEEIISEYEAGGQKDRSP